MLNFEKNSEYLIPIRKPPFYAFWGQRFSQYTHGGIVVNLNAEVLDKNGEIMPGLFAEGDCTTVNGSGEGGFPWSTMGGYFGGISAAKYPTGTKKKSQKSTWSHDMTMSVRVYVGRSRGFFRGVEMSGNRSTA